LLILEKVRATEEFAESIIIAMLDAIIGTTVDMTKSV
jgi:hypothetical protein